MWNGDHPPGTGTGIEVQAEVHATREEDEYVNVTTRVKKRNDDLTSKRDLLGKDADKISIAGIVSDVTPPPHPPSSTNYPPLKPFTPEWFEQVIGAAATAAATAVANARRPQAARTFDPSAPRRLNNRKVPDFSEDKPEF